MNDAKPGCTSQEGVGFIQSTLPKASTFALVVIAMAATGALAASAPDPVVVKAATAYIDSITKSVSIPSPTVVADSTAKWIGNFDLQSGRYTDLAGTYLIPFTGTDFDLPIPTAINGENTACMKHLSRMRNISAALSRGRWSGTDKTNAQTVLQKGMDYWAKINPFSYYKADGTLRYAVDPIKTTGSYNKLITYNGIISDILLTSRSQVATGSPITLDKIKSWAIAIEDTTAPAHFAGWTGTTYDQGANWWWRLNPRVARNWTIGFYDRADALIFAACDSVKFTFFLGGIPTAGDNYWISGFRPDGTYNQHGSSYNGQYGFGAVRDIINFGKVASGGGRYGLTESAKRIVIDHILDGSGRLSYKGTYSPDVMGRYFTQRYFGAPYSGYGLSGYNGFMPYLTSLGYRRNELEALSQWAVGNDFPWADKPSKVFPFGDLASWLRSDAGVFWKGVSNRLYREESYDNGEDAGNRLVLQMGLGVHWILANDGSQYFGNFMAVMDPSALPGTTSDSFDVPVWPSNNTVHIPGVTSFDGGVTDGKYMALANDLDQGAPGSTDAGRVMGKKATFFLDSAVVSLSAGMRWDRPTGVRTTLNQLNRRGDFLVARGTAGSKETLLGKGTANLPAIASGNDLRWAWHDSVGYVLPPNLSASATSDVRSASPARAGLGINKAKLPAIVTDTVASIWLSHGKVNVNKTSGDAFWYAFYPGISRDAFKMVADDARAGRVWTIDTNTSAIQAISVSAKKWHGAVFRTVGTVTTKETIPFVYGASRPCALLLRTTTDSLFLSLSDPAQGTSPVTVNLGIELAGVAYNSTTKSTSLTVALSTKPDSAGMTVQRAWKLKKGTSGTLAPTVRPKAQTRLLAGVGILVTAPEGSYHVVAHDLSGREVGSWNVNVTESGHGMIPVRTSLSKWILSVDP